MTRNRLLGNHAAHLEAVRCKGWAFNKALAVCSQKVIAIFFLKSSSRGNSIWVIHYSAWKFARDSQEVSAAVAWSWWNVKDFDNVWGCPEIGWCENVTKRWLPVAVQQLRERFTQAVEEKHYSLCSYFMRRCCTEASGLRGSLFKTVPELEQTFSQNGEWICLSCITLHCAELHRIYLSKPHFLVQFSNTPSFFWGDYEVWAAGCSTSENMLLPNVFRFPPKF